MAISFFCEKFFGKGASMRGGGFALLGRTERINCFLFALFSGKSQDGLAFKILFCVWPGICEDREIKPFCREAVSVKETFTLEFSFIYFNFV